MRLPHEARCAVRRSPRLQARSVIAVGQMEMRMQRTGRP